jgi:hypothetical protein
MADANINITAATLAAQLRECSCCDPDSCTTAPIIGEDPPRAWITLLTNAEYAPGVKALHNSLVLADSAYPLIVMVTPGVPESTLKELHGMAEASSSDGEVSLIVRPVAVLALPDGPGDRVAAYASPHFAETWSKLRAWELDEYERLAYLDADMCIVRNIDSLLEGEPLGDEESRARAACRIRAVPECLCVVPRLGLPCPYAEGEAPAGPSPPAARDEAAADADQQPGPQARRAYFNSGLLVLTPSRRVFAHMEAALREANLSSLPFPDQDFLNAFFVGAWDPLPWIFNATKGLYASEIAVYL